MAARDTSFLHTPSDDGDLLQVTGDTVRCILSGKQVGAAYSLWDVSTPSGRGPRPHRHLSQDEDFYVLEGEVEFTSGEETVRVNEGAVPPPGTAIRSPSP